MVFRAVVGLSVGVCLEVTGKIQKLLKKVRYGKGVALEEYNEDKHGNQRSIKKLSC
jgi:hypothetical protein